LAPFCAEEDGYLVTFVADVLFKPEDGAAHTTMAEALQLREAGDFDVTSSSRDIDEVDNWGDVDRWGKVDRWGGNRVTRIGEACAQQTFLELGIKSNARLNVRQTNVCCALVLFDCDVFAGHAARSKQHLP